MTINIIFVLKILLLLLLPGFFWIWFFVSNKNIFKNSVKALTPVFIMGIFVCVPAFAIEVFAIVIGKLIENKLTNLITAFFIVAPLEEYLKSLAVDIAGYTRNEKTETPQMLSWYFASAIGFASIENILYYLVAGTQIFLFRIFLTTIAHVVCSGIIGFFIAKYSMRNSESNGFAVGFVLATILHGLYDYALNILPGSIWFWIVVFLVLICFFESKLSAKDEE